MAPCGWNLKSLNLKLVRGVVCRYEIKLVRQPHYFVVHEIVNKGVKFSNKSYICFHKRFIIHGSRWWT